ncbi:hypothetical protein MP228_008970 [Amoeboaphelidium protococcarum]|nr:hypothetical protein MP228_008970 [Amoeboaphelidium protococcarum]
MVSEVVEESKVNINAANNVRKIYKLAGRVSAEDAQYEDSGNLVAVAKEGYLSALVTRLDNLGHEVMGLRKDNVLLKEDLKTRKAAEAVYKAHQSFKAKEKQLIGRNFGHCILWQDNFDRLKHLDHLAVYYQRLQRSYLRSSANVPDGVIQFYDAFAAQFGEVVKDPAVWSRFSKTRNLIAHAVAEYNELPKVLSAMEVEGLDSHSTSALVHMLKKLLCGQ